MKLTVSALLVLPSLGLLLDRSFQTSSQESAPAAEVVAEVVETELIETEANCLVLSQSLTVDVPVADAWAAYVTEEGWTSWCSPHAKIDLRPGGTIRTHYGEDAKVGDPGTITLHVINFVPERVLTLRAEVADHFPDVMKEDDGNLMEVILFEPLGPEKTRLTSYGVGYRDLPEYRELIEYFGPANAGLYRKLKETLEAKDR